MKLLKVIFEHKNLFVDGQLTIDLYAEDKVPAEDDSAFCLQKPLYSNSVIALAGINASGKTTMLRLLDFAISIACGRSLSSIVESSQLFSRMFDGIKVTQVFEQSGALYVLESTVAFSRSRLERVWELFKFEDETLYRWRGGSMPKKAQMADISTLLNGCEIYLRRNDLHESEGRFLSDSVSIATSVTDRDTPCVLMPATDDFNSINLAFDGSAETLRVFDPSVRDFSAGDQDSTFFITFASGGTVLASDRGLASVLSSGTAKGLRLVENAVAVLSHGGYLLVDEIENHLNKQLVNVMIDLFQSRETNPRGAVMVFTTHYPETLDRVHRKDNVYFLTRDSDAYRMQAIKYSHKVKRIENKKSEVFISSYIPGTAPKYSDVQALRDLVKKAAGEHRRLSQLGKGELCIADTIK